MNRKALKTLEYDKIIEMLRRFAGSESSARLIDEIQPITNASIIAEELRSTTEAVDLIVRKGPLPTGGIYDIEGALQLAKKGGTLQMKQLLQVHYDLNIAAQVITFMKSSDVPAELPLLREMTDLLVPVSNLEREIDRCILSEDEMADSASPKLRDIRRNIGQTNESIKNRLTQMVNSQANRAYLQDAIVTLREGRYVIPVKQEYRSRFPGMIHDQSKGGATLFVEPQAVVELNNRLRELEIQEEAEIQRILAELSSRVAEHFTEIRNNQKLLLRLDFIMAKGKLSRKMNGAAPTIVREGTLSLIRARHPLLDEKKAVPIDITFEDGVQTLIVTGPNTGGKTVSLKTAGLLSLMAQSGLHIPASERSVLPIFHEVFADIGDEQSIEQSLSTFSSHMKNIVDILGNTDKKSLVLLDELGAGTDPTEGAALAIAILERLKDEGALIMATTHYNELKKYALSTDGIENAAMEFDVDTLSPTYRLLIGVPGKSNAFEISRKLGIEDSIIDRAGHLIERGDMEFENVISSIEEDRKRAEDAKREAEAAQAEAEKKLAQIEEKQQAFDEKKAKILSKAREEARDIVKEAKEASKELQKELRAMEKQGRTPDNNRRYEQKRRRLREVEEKYTESVVKQVNSDPVSASDLTVGDRVKILTLGQNGVITTLPDDSGKMMVTVGAMKIGVKLEDIMLINEGKDRKKPKPASSSRYGGLYKQKTTSVSASVNVQGKNLEDALMDVEKYLDDVYIAGLDSVTIIHGRGEGILKNGIRSMLRRNKVVASYKPGTYNEGGEGVTIVTMKKN